MTQNIYDDPAFFAAYGGLPRSIHGLDGAPEFPALRAMLPPLNGARVLDLGCGYGWFCRRARENGAARVLGVDVSEKMLARAPSAGADHDIAYIRADLESFAPAPRAFEVAYSSLTFHYVENLGALLAAVHDALVPGGHLIFSVEHPIYTAPSTPGWSVDAGGHRTWPLDGYLTEGPRRTDWLTEGVIKQHRTIGRYVELLLGHGFTINHVEEWGPDAAQIATHPEWVIERERPMFLLMAARRGRTGAIP